MDEENKPKSKVGYRGPPPRKDLISSPMKEKDWKGHDIFCNTSTSEPKENGRGLATPIMESIDLGITPGLMNGDDYVDPHLKSHRDYDSDFVKLSLNGGHKDLLITGGDDEVDGERREKGCDNISEYNVIAKQGGHKDILRTDTPIEERPGTADRKQKFCDTENLSNYNKLAKTGGHKDLLRMDVETNLPIKGKGCENVSDYNKIALLGGRKDLLRLDKSEPIEDVDDRKPKKCENVSEYSKVAIQGGHKDILKTDRLIEPETSRKQKGCDTEHLSNYNKLSKTGGHKNLLKMDQKSDIDSRKGKGCTNVSDYAKMAMQGGHRDLLVIEENKPLKGKVSYERKGGDWFEHGINNNSPSKTLTRTPTKEATARPTSAAGGRRTVPTNGNKNQSDSILPAGHEHAHKTGKKRFDSSQRSEAPFATNW